MTLTLSVRQRGKAVVVGKTRVTVAAGHSHTVRVSLNASGRKLLADKHKLKTTLTMAHAGVTVAHATVTFKRP